MTDHVNSTCRAAIRFLLAVSPVFRRYRDDWNVQNEGGGALYSTFKQHIECDELCLGGSGTPIVFSRSTRTPVEKDRGKSARERAREEDNGRL